MEIYKHINSQGPEPAVIFICKTVSYNGITNSKKEAVCFDLLWLDAEIIFKLREIILGWCSWYLFQTKKAEIYWCSLSNISPFFCTLHVLQERMLRRMKLKKTPLLLIFRMYKMPSIWKIQGRLYRAFLKEKVRFFLIKFNFFQNVMFVLMFFFGN